MASGMVDRRYKAGKQNAVFKGKWYPRLLAEDVKKAAGGRKFRDKGLEETILSLLSASLDVNAAWVGSFRAPIQKVLGQAGL